MACFRPNMVLIEKHDLAKNKLLRFVSGNDKNNSPWFYEYFDTQNKMLKDLQSNQEWTKVPCGQCAGCQQDYSRQWAIRCIMEASNWEDNIFLTLTYDEDHLPDYENDEIVDKNGVIYENDGTWKGALQPRDWELFMKKLREHWRKHYNHTGIKFYMCGEYGGQNGRPHYHAILFNFPIKWKELKIHRMNVDGSIIYECPEIKEIWEKGFITVAEVNWDTCAYVARYVMKKLKAIPAPELYYEQGQIPEFVRMSRRPGIGKENFKPEWYTNDEIIIKGHRQNIQTVRPPKYYDKMYDELNHEHMNSIKNQRKEQAEMSRKMQMSKTSLYEAQQLKIEEAEKLKAWKSLKRDKV